MTDLVTVFQSSDVALLALAKAALEQAGIRFVSESEGIQHLFPTGGLFIGPPRISVTQQDEARAREVLSELS